MGLIKKIDVPKHFAARRAMRLASRQPVSLPDATGFSEIEPVSAAARASEFKKDFALEHTSSKLTTISAPIAADIAGNYVISAPRSRKA